MKFLAPVTAFFAGLAAAAPSAKRTDGVTLKFWAAAQTSTFDVYVPLDGQSVIVTSELSFTMISADAPAGVYTKCEVYGVDDSYTVLYNSAYNIPIGPPQEQTYAVCNTY